MGRPGPKARKPRCDEGPGRAPVFSRRSSRPRFQIDTLEKALDILSYARCCHKADSERHLIFMFLLNKYPELTRCTHEHLGDILGHARETITRLMSRVKVKSGTYILRGMKE